LFVDGGGAVRVFHLITGSVIMTGLTIQRGVAPATSLVPFACSDGGGGGGILIDTGSSLRLSNASVSQNTALGSGTLGGAGGGICSVGSMTLSEVELGARVGGVTVSGNTAQGSSRAATGGVGGGIAMSFGAAVLNDNITVSGNTAGSGAG